MLKWLSQTCCSGEAKHKIWRHGMLFTWLCWSKSKLLLWRCCKIIWIKSRFKKIILHTGTSPQRTESLGWLKRTVKCITRPFLIYLHRRKTRTAFIVQSFTLSGSGCWRRPRALPGPVIIRPAPFAHFHITTTHLRLRALRSPHSRFLNSQQDDICRFSALSSALLAGWVSFQFTLVKRYFIRACTFE